MLKTIFNLTWKEMLQLYRDRIMLVFLIVMPALQLYLMANATGAGVRHIKFAVWDQERSDLSQTLITALDNTETFELAFRVRSYEELRGLVDQGQVGAALIIPPDFSREVQRADGGAQLPVIVDATSVIVASSVLGAIQGAVNDLMMGTLLPSSAPLPGGIDVRVETAFNATLNFRWSTMPAQLAFITYQLVLVVAAVGFVRERELGTLEQLAVTPIRRLELLLGKGLLAVIIGVVNLFLLHLLLIYGFQIPMRGSLALLMGLGLLFIAAEIGVGTIISLVSSSQQQSILIVFLIAMLEITFSGLLVPTENMPAFMQVLAAVSPLQHFTGIVRAIFLKGAPLEMMTNHVAPLAVLAVTSLGGAWVLFARTRE